MSWAHASSQLSLRRRTLLHEEDKLEEDDDDLFVKPSTAAAEPKGSAQQLVNTSTKPVKPKTEPVDNASPSPMLEDLKPRRDGVDWRIATSALARDYGGEVHEDDGLPFDDVEGDFLDDDATGKWNLRNVSSNQGYVKRGTLSASRRPAGGDELAQGRLPDGKRNESDIPIDAAGAQYWHVFGSTATAFERFVVDHKITGPCWLNISKPVAIQDLQHYPNLNLGP
ncbi:hypothetical protein RTG_03029 [Rhodotorula toruloides ATCC 204091]|uniref:Uncharacterized protein n=1 Tax=Rhodotorula toruloides TaxID=5286 RepID=A0A0K3CK72_RHOTO|nr:hypothetical protein RTG_03029 [Rhodotorula toruloides ATCC 204091]